MQINYIRMISSNRFGLQLSKCVLYRPRALQHLHARKLRATWRISMKNPRKKLAFKILHEVLHADFLHANLSVLLRWLILLTKIDASCMYFFTTKCGWCKIRNQHCGKTSFRGEKENNLLYTFSYYNNHATIANVMFCVMSAHQTKSSIKADSYLQNTDTFSSRHVHLLCTHNASGLGYTDNPTTNTLHLPPF